jgi:hypothetical protein
VLPQEAIFSQRAKNPRDTVVNRVKDDR